MDLQPVTTVSTPAEDRTWLASRHGMDCTVSATFDVQKFKDAGITKTYSGDPNVYIPSGTAVVKNDATSLYEPAITTSDGGTTWAQAADALHIFETVKAGAASTHAAGAVQWHGAVIAAKVPVPAGAPAFDPAQGSPLFRYV